jgi:hypothetical protein
LRDGRCAKRNHEQTGIAASQITQGASGTRTDNIEPNGKPFMGSEDFSSMFQENPDRQRQHSMLSSPGPTTLGHPRSAVLLGALIEMGMRRRDS